MDRLLGRALFPVPTSSCSQMSVTEEPIPLASKDACTLGAPTLIHTNTYKHKFKKQVLKSKPRLIRNGFSLLSI